jgi:anti-sigma28 factor (negative regulator of flagellin synthesis)
VELSPDVELANVAAQAAANSSDIRPEEVARARELLNSGQIGNDLESLAQKIIDSLIK